MEVIRIVFKDDTFNSEKSCGDAVSALLFYLRKGYYLLLDFSYVYNVTNKMADIFFTNLMNVITSKILKNRMRVYNLSSDVKEVISLSLNKAVKNSQNNKKHSYTINDITLEYDLSEQKYRRISD